MANTKIIRGNDELSYWLKGANPNSTLEVTIAFNIFDMSRCPMPKCHFKIDDLFGFNKNHYWVKLSNDGFKRLLQHFKLFHGRYPVELQVLSPEPIEHPDYYQEYEKDVLNKSIAMLQVLVKYEVNSNNTQIQRRKRGECVYRLSKDFLLTNELIMRLLDIPDIRKLYKLLDTGLDEYYGGREHYPTWMKRVMD